ncbi:Glycosyltransferase sugar-binding region containing DXD motif-containing protein [Pseudoxanthomonas sp. GM95]|uniref:glycosyltransferase family 32 protein n=1 Tax=Pseudoxanthomonas sp. GM95 TaxID=1881043 RepID=UPI0008C48C7C|nr:glycosyltransferase [Pseudoxanthomonas sp. GM95]SEK82104.1 Glycosyltransferase sugar-binding region containing DXD motif-containing protein [Pseudoxanthomonas sp. GM95]
MIPAVFHLTAPTKQLQWEERRVRARLHRLLHGWEGFLWDDADNAALIRSTFPQFADRYDAIQFGVLKADIARCAYLHAYGGFYFDTDYKLLRNLDRTLLVQPCVLPVEEGRPGSADFKIGNAVLGSEAGHPFWGDFIEHVFTQHAPETLTDHRRIPHVSGPSGMTDFYLANAWRYRDLHFPPRDHFHPDRTWFGLGHLGGKEAVGSHLCWASWRGKTPRRAVTNFLRRKLTAAPI